MHDEQPLRLGDELFLLGLKDRNGDFELSDRAMALTLGGAELAELASTESIRITPDGSVQMVPKVHAELGSRTWDLLRLLSHEERTLGSWIQFLALTSLRAVAERLVNAHRVRVETRGWITKRTVYEPVDRNFVYGRRVRLSHLAEHQKLTTAEIVLLELVTACDLRRIVIWNAGSSTNSYIDGRLAGLRASPRAWARSICLISSAISAQIARVPTLTPR
jgi:hypothetical protein